MAAVDSKLSELLSSFWRIDRDVHHSKVFVLVQLLTLLAAARASTQLRELVGAVASQTRQRERERPHDGLPEWSDPRSARPDRAPRRAVRVARRPCLRRQDGGARGLLPDG